MSVRLTAFLSDGPALRAVFPDNGSYLIGRGEEADFRLPDKSVSRAHMRLSAHPQDGWQIQDLGSKNGTQLNGCIIDQATISENVWLSLGGAHVLVELIAARAAKAAANAEQGRADDAEQFRQAIDAGQSASDIFENLAASIISLSSCDRCSIWLADASSEPALVHRQGREIPKESLSTIRETFRRSAEIISNDIEGVAAFAKRESILLGGVRAMVCMPFDMSGSKGAAYADSQKPGKYFSELDVEMLRTVTRHAALTLASLNLRDQIADLTARR